MQQTPDPDLAFLQHLLAALCLLTALCGGVMLSLLFASDGAPDASRPLSSVSAGLVETSPPDGTR